MKKTLLAAALIAGGFAGTAMAQNSVTMYGRVAPWLVWDQIKVPNKVARAVSTARNPIEPGTRGEFSTADGFAPGASFWGVRGIEDLGNGLKVNFNFEGQVSTTSGAFSGFNRKAYLGVANDAWGEFRIGRDYLPSDDMLSGISPLGVAFGVGSAQRAFPFSQNVGNQISFRSAAINGFRVGLAYSFAGSTVQAIDPETGKASTIADGGFGNSKNRLLNAGVRYANGPILLAAAYTQVFPGANSNVNGNKGPKNWLLGGAYDFKVVRVHAAYGQNIDGRVSGAGGLSGLTGVDGEFGLVGSNSIAQPGARTNQWLAGLTAPVGEAGRAMFGISQMAPGGDFKVDNAVLTTATQTNLGVAYQYSLSNRTSLYASYSYAQNYLMLKGLQSNQVGVGVVHTF